MFCFATFQWHKKLKVFQQKLQIFSKEYLFSSHLIQYCMGANVFISEQKSIVKDAKTKERAININNTTYKFNMKSKTKMSG